MRSLARLAVASLSGAAGLSHQVEVVQLGQDALNMSGGHPMGGTHFDHLEEKSHGLADQKCSGEELWVVRQFERALGTQDVDMMWELFAEKGEIVTPHKKRHGRQFFKEFLPKLSGSTVAEEQIFCEIDTNKAPTVSLRYRHKIEKKGRGIVKDGVYMAHFRLRRAKDRRGKPLVIELAEIFVNKFVHPAKGRRHIFSYDMEQGICSQEAKELARGYIDALGGRDLHGITEMFTHGGYVLSTSQGHKKPVKFFGPFFALLDEAKTVEDALFCQMDSQGSPMMAVRFQFHYKLKGRKKYEGGEFFAQFAFVRENKRAPLRLKSSEMFENGLARVADIVKDQSYMETKGGAECSYDALGLVRKFLRVLGDCDDSAVKHLFAPDSVVNGENNARKFYANLLGKASHASTEEQAIFCEHPTKKNPMMSVRFNYAYKYKGRTHSASFFAHIKFGRRHKYAPLQIRKLDLFKNKFGKATNALGHSSFLEKPDHELEHKEHDRIQLAGHRRGSKAEGCSKEASQLVKTYYYALSHKDWDALDTVLAPHAKLLSPQTGARLAGEYFKSVLPLFYEVSAKEEDQFCEMHEGFGTIAVRSYVKLDKKGGVTFDHFFFTRQGKHAPLQVREIAIFDNKLISPHQHQHRNHRSGHSDHGHCSDEAFEVVEQYLHALSTKDVDAMGKIFAPHGHVLSRGTGLKSAKAFFAQFLPLLSDVHLKKTRMGCNVEKHGPPTVVVSFDYAYSLAGMMAGAHYKEKFYFIRTRQYVKLQVELVKMVQSHHESDMTELPEKHDRDTREDDRKGHRTHEISHHSGKNDHHDEKHEHHSSKHSRDEHHSRGPGHATTGQRGKNVHGAGEGKHVDHSSAEHFDFR